MGDRVYTSIRFSGVINHDIAAELLDELMAQGCRCDEGHNDTLTVADLTGDNNFYDSECNYASMDEVEAFCRDHGISYRKHWEAGGGFDAGYELYNAITGITFDAPGGEEPCLGTSHLRAASERGNTLQDVIAYLEAIENFHENYPPLEIRE